MVLHFVNGSVIFPLIYTAVLYHVLPGAPAVKGLIWGAVLWLLAQILVMPMMGGGFFSANAGGMPAVIGSLMGTFSPSEPLRGYRSESRAEASGAAWTEKAHTDFRPSVSLDVRRRVCAQVTRRIVIGL